MYRNTTKSGSQASRLHKLQSALNVVFIALAMSVLAIQPAKTSVATDVVSIVHLWADGFNRADGRAIAASCAEQASIVDDFPPHEWSGTGACARWFTDFQTFAQRADVTDAVVAIDEPGHVDVTADAAYVVAPVTLTYRAKGKPAKLKGIITVVLHQRTGSWHITALTWADL